MAEWLGNGLQNRVQQFDSAWYLKKSPVKGLFFYVPGMACTCGNLFYQMV